MAMSEGFTSSDIKKNIGVLSTSKSGWNLELNFVSWGRSSCKVRHTFLGFRASKNGKRRNIHKR